MQKRWIALSENVTIEITGVRACNVGGSTYLYVKYIGERKSTGYSMGTNEAAKGAHKKLTDALTAIKGDSKTYSFIN